MIKKLISVVLPIFLVISIATIYVNRQFLYDYYMASTYQLEPQAEQLAHNIDLTDRGLMLFTASKSKVQAAEVFNQSCRGVHQELTIVLGCYTNRRIYIYDITDERLAGAKEVTAAHELLHAAYERLPSKERVRVDQLLEKEAEGLTEGKIKDSLLLYEEATPDHLRHERYAILGTEAEIISPELEDHFSKYFRNRQKIVDYSQQYNDVFSKIEKQLKDYDLELEELMNTKTDLDRRLQSIKSDLTRSDRMLAASRASGNTSQYNLQVPVHNSLVARHNDMVGELRMVVNEYNELVETRNSIAVTQSDLIKHLDSNYKAVE